MDDEYDLSKVPFFNEFQADFTNFGGDMVIRGEPGDLQTNDPYDILQVRQNIQKMAKSIQRLEEMLHSELRAGGQKQKRTFWAQDEHFQFLRLLQKFGRENLKEIARAMGTVRTIQQVRTHAQKYFEKLDKHQADAHRQVTAVLLHVQASVLQKAQLFQNRVQQNVSAEPQHATVLKLLTNPLTVLDEVVSQELTPQQVPIPLQCVSSAQKILRSLYPEIPYGSYYVTQTADVTAQVLLAVSGHLQPQLVAVCGFAQLVYRQSNDLMVDKTAPNIKFNMSSIDFETEQPEFVQLNAAPFLPFCAAYLTNSLLQNRQFLQDLLVCVALLIKYIQQVNDPFDYAIQKVAEAVRRSADEVCAMVFSYSVVLAYKQ